MQTQVPCPQCGRNFVTDVHQVVDSKRTPHLKQALLTGQLNLAQCPHCGYAAQLSTMLLFHDPEYEIFMVHVPEQLNMSTEQREQMIGKMAQQVMDSLPQEERRAYMFQPEMMLNYQSFLERVLETEGVTKEQIQRQKKQADLLRRLIGMDKDVVDHLVKENINLIDEDFLSMVQTFLDQSLQMNDSKAASSLTNLRVKLMTETPAGQAMQRRETAVRKLQKSAKKEGGLTPQLLVDALVENVNDEDAVDGIVAAGQQAMTYEFFTLLTEELEKREAAGDPSAQKLKQLRGNLLELQKAMQDQSRAMLAEAEQTIQAIIDAEDKKEALALHLDKVDDAFMYVISMKMQEAQQQNDKEAFAALAEIQAMIMALVESQLPPELQMLNQLVRTDSSEQQDEILNANQAMLNEDMLQMMDRVIGQARESGQADQQAHLEAIKEKIAERVG